MKGAGSACGLQATFIYPEKCVRVQVWESGTGGQSSRYSCDTRRAPALAVSLRELIYVRLATTLVKSMPACLDRLVPEEVKANSQQPTANSQQPRAACKLQAVSCKLPNRGRQ